MRSRIKIILWLTLALLLLPTTVFAADSEKESVTINSADFSQTSIVVDQNTSKAKVLTILKSITAKVTLSDDTIINNPEITWDLAAYNEDQPGSQSVPATVTVTFGDEKLIHSTSVQVDQRGFKSVKEISSVVVPYRTSKEIVEKLLPGDVTIVMSDDSTRTVPVVWDMAQYDANRVIAQQIRGSFSYPEGILHAKKAWVYVIVEKSVVTEVKNPNISLSVPFNTSKEEVEKLIEETFKEKPVVYTNDHKESEHATSYLVDLKEYNPLRLGTQKIPIKATLPIHMQIKEESKLSDTFTIPLKVQGNYTELKRLYYVLDGNEVEIPLETEYDVQKTLYSVVLKEGVRVAPIVKAVLSDKATGATITKIEQAKYLPDHPKFHYGTNVASLTVVSEDKTASTRYQVHFITTTNPMMSKRIQGVGRIETAVEASKEYFRFADAVVIASKDNFADALSAAPLASMNHAPILLTGSDSLPSVVTNEILRLEAKHVIIVGGERSISKTIADAITRQGMRVSRYGGADRYETSLAVAKEVARQSLVGSMAVLVDGTKFPDALASSYIATEKEIPILLTKPDDLPNIVLDYLVNTKNEIVYVVGGPKSVSEEIVKKIENLEFTDHVTRLAGEDRYQTALKVAGSFAKDAQVAFVADGRNYVDALVAGAITRKVGAPILLVDEKFAEKGVDEYIEKSSISYLHVIGGLKSVPKWIETELLKAIK